MQTFLPVDIREQLDAYVKEGRPLGSCLEAAIANDMLEFFSRADNEHVEVAFAIASYIHNRVPANAHGSRRVYRSWLAANKAMREGVELAPFLAENEAAYSASREAKR